MKQIWLGNEAKYVGDMPHRQSEITPLYSRTASACNGHGYNKAVQGVLYNMISKGRIFSDFDNIGWMCLHYKSHKINQP